MNAHGVEITDIEVSDSDRMGDLIPEEISMLLEKVIADGAYYSKEIVEDFSNEHSTGQAPWYHCRLKSSTSCACPLSSSPWRSI